MSNMDLSNLKKLRTAEWKLLHPKNPYLMMELIFTSSDSESEPEIDNVSASLP